MIKDIGKVLLGGGGGHLLQLAAMPILATLYSDTAMGVYFTSLALAAVLTVVFSAQAQHAVPVQKTERAATDFIVFSSSVSICFLLAGLITLAVSDKSKLVDIICFSVMIAAVASMGQVLRSSFLRESDLNSVSVLIFLRGAFIVILQILLFYILGDSGLIAGLVLGESLCLSVMIYKKWQAVAQNYEKGWLHRIIKEKKDFYLYGVGQELVSTGLFNIPLLFMPVLYGVNAAGQFGMAFRIIWPPFVLLSTSIINVIYARMRGVDIYQYMQVIKRALPFYPVVVVGLIAASLIVPEIFVFLLGRDWQQAAEISGVLLLWAGFFLMSCPFRAAYRMYQLQKLQLKLDSVMIILSGLVSAVFYVMVEEGSDLSVLSLVIAYCALGIVQNVAIATIASYRAKK